MTDAYILHEPLPELEDSTMVVMLEGWIDASGTGAAAIAALRQQCNCIPLATFAGDEFIDYRARRPVLALRDGVVTDLRWPVIEVAVGQDRVGHDVVTLSGPEPDSQWQRFVAEAVALAEQLNVTTMVGLGAYPFATPHTRDARLSVTSPNAEYVGTLTYLKNSLDVPAGMGAALEMTADRRGIRAFGLWAQVPHYISSPGYPAASMALLHGLRETTGVDVDLTELAGEADQHRRRLDLLVASNEEHKVMVRQMEELYDAAVQQSPALDPSQIPSGEQLAAEFERFLRDQGRGRVTLTQLTGWGGTIRSGARLLPVTAGNVAEAVAAAPPRGALMRGLGRSYGDAAQNAGGLVMRLAGNAGDAVLDAPNERVTVGAGVSIDELLRVLVPRGFFVPVTPGTRFVTIGGAIASDIHGKNHHRDGSFGNHVQRISILLADGSVVEAGPTERADLFWATVGGMGLTGVVLEATVHVLPIETSRMVVDTTRAHDLDHILTLMEDSDHRYQYTVAWIDLMARGRHLGRSILTLGEHAGRDLLTGDARDNPLVYHARVIAGVPPVFPVSALNRVSIKAFNELWFRKSPTYRLGELQTIPQYFHPLDMLGSWNRTYGPRGFVQFQILVPFGEEHALQQVIERLASSGAASFVTVLKRFGVSNPAPLSFPAPGWTLTLDIPAGTAGLSEMLHELDDVVLDAGGRHYLAKDAHTTAAAIARGYPRLPEWREVRDRYDPTGVWRSDLGRRLGLID